MLVNRNTCCSSENANGSFVSSPHADMGQPIEAAIAIVANFFHIEIIYTSADGRESVKLQSVAGKPPYEWSERRNLVV